MSASEDMTAPVLLVASTNKKKLGEIQDLLKGMPFEIINLTNLAGFKEVVEDGVSFRENAAKKALGYAEQSGLLTLAEDSGLCCDALEGAPGIYSARFAGEGKSDADNNAKLLRVLENVPVNCRGAHYTSVIAIAEPGKIIGYGEGEVHGFIHHELKGTGGFGYDPLFFYPPFQKTFGEVSPEMKHQVSHRFKALLQAKEVLKHHAPAGGR